MIFATFRQSTYLVQEKSISLLCWLFVCSAPQKNGAALLPLANRLCLRAFRKRNICVKRYWYSVSIQLKIETAKTFARQPGRVARTKFKICSETCSKTCRLGSSTAIVYCIYCNERKLKGDKYSVLIRYIYWTLATLSK
jgi:hypothetical protein